MHIPGQLQLVQALRGMQVWPAAQPLPVVLGRQPGWQVLAPEQVVSWSQIEPAGHCASEVQVDFGWQRGVPQPQAAQASGPQDSLAAHSASERQPGMQALWHCSVSPQTWPEGQSELEAQPGFLAQCGLQPHASQTACWQKFPVPQSESARHPETQAGWQSVPTPQIIPGPHCESLLQAALGTQRPLQPQALHGVSQRWSVPHSESARQPGRQTLPQASSVPQIWPEAQS
jgi:hypothetical protein